MPNLYLDKQMHQRDAAAKQLHNRLVLQDFVDRSTGMLRPFWGRVHSVQVEGFMDPQHFNAHCDDGDIYTTAQ